MVRPTMLVLLSLLSVESPAQAGAGTTMPLVQAIPASPVRLGFSGSQFTRDDLAQMEALAREAGGTVWIVTGAAPAFLPGRWSAQVFLRPDNAGTTVRRGHAFNVSAQIPMPDAYSVPKKWVRQGAVFEYAQVPRPGQDPDNLSGSRDVTRPFLLTGTIDDDSLANLVAVLRASPRFSGAAAGASALASTVDGSSPIQRIRVSPGAGASVSLIGPDPREKNGQSVQLRSSGLQWVVTGIALWIAD